MMISLFMDKDYMMQRNRLIIVIVLAIIVIAVFIYFQYTLNNVPPLPSTIALQTLVTIPGKCDSFNADWSLVSASGIIYDATTGKVRLTTKSSGTAPAYTL